MSTDDTSRGWPTGRHDPLTVEGRIEQVGKVAEGLRSNTAGRRRAGRLVLVPAVLIVLLVGLVVLGTLLGR